MTYAYVKARWRIASLIVSAFFFFWIYLFLYRSPLVVNLAPVEESGASMPAYLVLNQPDEAVNYWFIRALALDGRASIPLTLQTYIPQIVHPRSTTIVGGMLVPISFPGMLALYGSLLAIIFKIAPFAWFNLFAVSITPLLGAATPLILYALLRRFFDERVAWASAALLWIQPAWWYYSSRPFQHHTLLLFILLCALNALACACMRAHTARAPRMLWLGTAGLLWGFTLYVRPVEVIWVSVIFAALLYYYRHRWSIRDLAQLAVGIIVACIVFFATNVLYYGAPLGTGYVQPADDGTAAGTLLNSSVGLSGKGILSVLTLPFGFHPSNIWYNFKGYAYHLPGVWFWFFGASILYMLHEWRGRALNRRMVWFLAALGALGVYLFSYYGSWLFFDNVMRMPSIGSSYARYFLPISVMSVVPIAYAFASVITRHKNYAARFGACSAAMLLIIGSYVVVNAPLEGLASVKRTVQGYYSARETLRAALPGDSVIVTRYADKYLFPLFQTIVSWDQDKDWDAVEKLLSRGIPVFWYERRLAPSAEKIISGVLSGRKLRMSEVLFEWDGLELRQILR